MKLTREQVYTLIDLERAHQIRKWGTFDENLQLVEKENSVAAWLVFIKHYTDRAIDELTQNPSDEKALEQVRKLTALGVACLEQHGASSRAFEHEVISIDYTKMVPMEIYFNRKDHSYG